MKCINILCAFNSPEENTGCIAGFTPSVCDATFDLEDLKKVIRKKHQEFSRWNKQYAVLTGKFLMW